MGYKLIPAKHPCYGGMLREEALDLPMAAALIALQLEVDGSVVVNEAPTNGQIQSWRKTAGVMHVFAIHGSGFTDLNLMMYDACFRYQDIPSDDCYEHLVMVDQMMQKAASNTQVSM